MIWLLLGLALWIGAHFFKRYAPDARASMQDMMGDGSKGVIALAVLVSVILMVVGYRSWFTGLAYSTPTWGVHLNNLLMFLAIIFLGLGSSKSRFRGTLRHPMLTGVFLWAVAHLLVNGDWASVVLFGTLGAWAIAEMIVINRAVPEWDRPEPGTVGGDVRLVLIAGVLMAVISGIHYWLGYPVFPV